MSIIEPYKTEIQGAPIKTTP